MDVNESNKSESSWKCSSFQGAPVLSLLTLACRFSYQLAMGRWLPYTVAIYLVSTNVNYTRKIMESTQLEVGNLLFKNSTKNISILNTIWFNVTVCIYSSQGKSNFCGSHIQQINFCSSQARRDLFLRLLERKSFSHPQKKRKHF